MLVHCMYFVVVRATERSGQRGNLPQVLTLLGASQKLFCKIMEELIILLNTSRMQLDVAKSKAY